MTREANAIYPTASFMKELGHRTKLLRRGQVSVYKHNANLVIAVFEQVRLADVPWLGTLRHAGVCSSLFESANIATLKSRGDLLFQFG